MEVSVDIILVSVDIVLESDEELPDLLELQAATAKDNARAKKPNFNEFFIMVVF
jgi:hypothetical protein